MLNPAFARLSFSYVGQDGPDCVKTSAYAQRATADKSSGRLEFTRRTEFDGLI